MLKNWIVVYIGNFVGSIFVTGFFTLGNIYSMFNSSVAKSVISIATTKCNLSIQEMFFRAILCNILVCVAVMMAATSKTVGGKIIGLFLPNYGIRNLRI
ncbi:MAG: formate/nitrite transporter family protein [Eubacterium ventriosum]